MEIHVPEQAPYSERFASHSAQRYPLGTRLVYPDGREFRYGRMGAANAVAGKLFQSEVPGSNHDTLSVAAVAAVGAREISVTNGATTVVADEWKGGYLVVEDTAALGAGRAYLIEGNDAEAAGSAAYTIRLNEGIQEAFTASTVVTLVKHPYDDVIIHPSPPTAKVVGVPCIDLPATYFGWLQTKGLASVLIDGTVAIGKSVMPSDAVDGAVEAWGLTEATPNTEIAMPVGHVVEVAPDTKYGAIYLTIE